MTNDTTTLNGALAELGETMADNLVSMGVIDADPSDGLTTLAGKILDVEPSISGLDLDTALTLSSSSASIIVGQSIVLSSKLTASYDDETIVDVDLTGVLTGATVLFKEGSTTLGSGVTDSTGVATATISGLSLGSHTIKAVFAGTENFDDCESTSITVVVSNPTPDSMVLVKSAGKQILSYADVSGGDEYCTIKATVYDASENPLAGETVTFSIGGTTVKSDVTDSNGEITYTYVSQGVGDVTITAECRLLIQTYTLEDCIKYDSTEHSQSFNTSTTSQEVITGLSWDNTDDWECTYDFKASANGKRVDIVPPTESLSHHLGFGRDGQSKTRVYIGKSSSGEDSYTHSDISLNTYYTVVVKKEGTSVTFKLNGTTLNTYPVSWLSNYQFEGIKYTSWSASGTIYLKNLKIKPL